MVTACKAFIDIILAYGSGEPRLLSPRARRNQETAHFGQSSGKGSALTRAWALSVRGPASQHPQQWGHPALGDVPEGQ